VRRVKLEEGWMVVDGGRGLRGVRHDRRAGRPRSARRHAPFRAGPGRGARGAGPEAVSAGSAPRERLFVSHKRVAVRGGVIGRRGPQRPPRPLRRGREPTRRIRRWQRPVDSPRPLWYLLRRPAGPGGGAPRAQALVGTLVVRVPHRTERGVGRSAAGSPLRPAVSCVWRTH
jgi:hypothetical protein